MVKPLSRKRRFLLLFIFIVFFIIFLPLVVFYSSGYRIGEDWTIVKTGAIYIEIPVTDSIIYLGDKEVGRTSFLRGSFFVQDLTPKKYEIRVMKEGYITWNKDIYVREQMISKVVALILPEKINRIQIPQFIGVSSPISIASSSVSFISSNLSTTSVIVTKINKDKATTTEEYRSVLSLFSTTTSINSGLRATSTQNLFKTNGKMSLWYQGKSIIAEWVGNDFLIPDFMCVEGECSKKSRVTRTETIKNLDFFLNREDVIIYSDNYGVYIIEIDKNNPQNKITLSNRSDGDFRISEDNKVYLYEKGIYYLLEL